MKHNVNVFSTTKKNLSQYNSRMLIVFLLLFNIVISVFLFINMYNEQKVTMIDIAKQEIKELQTDGEELSNDQNHTTGTESTNNNTQGVLLTYFLKSNNELLIIDEFSPQMRTVLLKIVENWKPVEMEVKYQEVEISKEDSVYLLIVSQNVYEHDKLKGTIYIGKDITFLRNMFIHFLFILLGISLIFFVIALVVGRVMTKRAMDPIIKTYHLQSEFIADASHELRTPLSVVKSGLDVIEYEEGNKFSAFSKSILSDLKEEIRSTTQLVSNLLFLIRSDSGEQSSFVEHFDLQELMQQILRSFHHLSETKKIKLDLQTLTPLGLLTDREKLKQLLYILMDNAMKYTPSNGKISIYYELKSDQQSEMLYIVVSDNGIGIPIEQQERIFDRFYRVDKSRSRQSGSSGLGLPIGKSIVESLNGTIEVSSSLDKGSEFTIMIPLSKNQN
ncbi:sensor histidine kinase [Psychrobacillus glaciei]|uniref:histidine kinase n=1 Tax=Psychrobacillus glaciei TaxID=2283160 RepID=A0A5J6SQJ7_9BACI|nr:HAMP domain-containing sensor histidine kinase [Psychrobacillus glaciei]QFF98427.1 sensor histidine kinase [Psychrobacillus glaciei]